MSTNKIEHYNCTRLCRTFTTDCTSKKPTPAAIESFKKRTRHAFNSLTDLSDQKVAAASSMDTPTKISNEVIEKELERMMTTTSSRAPTTIRKGTELSWVWQQLVDPSPR